MKKIVWYTIGVGWDMKVDCCYEDMVPQSDGSQNVEVFKTFREAIYSAVTHCIIGRNEYAKAIRNLRAIRRGSRLKALKRSK